LLLVSTVDGRVRSIAMSKVKYSHFRHDEIGSQADEFIFRRNGSNEDDIYVGNARNNTYNGRGGNDSLLGDWGNDRLNGGNGFDYVMGQGGNDRLFGGPSDDTIAGDVGRDIMTGGKGLDNFLYTANGIFLFGGHGFDTITDFDPKGRDGDLITMMINPNFGVGNFQQLRAGMQQVRGDTIMDFGNGDVLVLNDVRIAELSADNFSIFMG
jgi:Ca2+-binding RTX toxin-like protein